ncbi:hypothetical protein A2154_04970 [Candidatus Gottesmanbacteria bacterium RBG_16_43_7]|uniref:Uncharacterized protein n=1 Tax=Candidatus Gottesmanbacteria bacterium RBG_16_43_7 TaxID=1798373 RepID=A0A1F5ZD61_9BACT|nr:MAG: hypothetical protein A2154_04970 [Candidatus Gottesmanbacteria bacterium RBG_16_43_7]
MTNFQKHKLSRGQSLVEVVVALGISILMISGIVVGVNTSMRTVRENRARSAADKLIQDALEIARKDRDSNWIVFRAQEAKWLCLNDNSTTFFGLVDQSSQANARSNCINIATTPGVSFIRYAHFEWVTVSSTEGMRVTVYVDWLKDTANWNSVSTSTFLTDWK